MAAEPVYIANKAISIVWYIFLDYLCCCCCLLLLLFWKQSTHASTFCISHITSVHFTSCVRQLPWPNGPGENIFALPKTDAMTCVDRKKTLRTLQLRWHPDKIQQKWGRRCVFNKMYSAAYHVLNILKLFHVLPVKGGRASRRNGTMSWWSVFGASRRSTWSWQLTYHSMWACEFRLLT